MSFKKETFTITTDAFGAGETDARLNNAARTRPCILRAVELTESPGGNPKVTLYELPYDTVELVYDLGDQVFYSASLGTDGRVHPRLATVDDTGVAISGEESGDIYIDESYVRATIEDGAASGSYTLVVTYETAGDYRF